MQSSVLSLSYAAWAHPSGEWISDNNEVYFGRDGSGNHYYSKFAFKTPKVMGKPQKLTLSLITSQQSNPTPNVAYLSQEDLQADQLSSTSSYIAQAASNHTANTNVLAGTSVEFAFDTDALKPDTTYFIYVKRVSSNYNGFTGVYNPLYVDQGDKASILLEHIHGVIRLCVDGVIRKAVPLVGKDGVPHNAILLVGSGGAVKIPE